MPKRAIERGRPCLPREAPPQLAPAQAKSHVAPATQLRTRPPVSQQQYPGIRGDSIFGTRGGETSTPTSHLQKQDAGGWTGSTALTGGEKSWNAPAGGGCFFSGGELWKSWDFIYTAPCSVLEARPKGFEGDIKKGASWPQQYYRVPYVGTIAVPRLIARTKGWVLLLARMQKQLHSRPRLYRRSWKQHNRANQSLSYSGGVNNIRSRRVRVN